MWIKLDDGFATHPKILEAGILAQAIQVRAICYAHQNQTDGLIPFNAVPLLLIGLERIGIETATSELAAFGVDAEEVDWPAHMLKHGLWEQTDRGYLVHNYLKWNPSKKQIEVLKKKQSAGGKIAMKARWGKGLEGDKSTYKSTHKYTRKSPSISISSLNSLPSAELDSDLKSNGHADEFEAFWLAYPKKVGKKKARAAWMKATDRPALRDMLQALEHATRTDQWRKDNGQYIPHPSTWLNEGRWSDDQTCHSAGTRPPPPPPKNDPIGRGLWGKTYGRPEDYGYQ